MCSVVLASCFWLTTLEEWVPNAEYHNCGRTCQVEPAPEQVASLMRVRQSWPLVLCTKNGPSWCITSRYYAFSMPVWNSDGNLKSHPSWKREGGKARTLQPQARQPHRGPCHSTKLWRRCGTWGREPLKAGTRATYNIFKSSLRDNSMFTSEWPSPLSIFPLAEITYFLMAPVQILPLGQLSVTTGGVLWVAVAAWRSAEGFDWLGTTFQLAECNHF